MRDRHERFRHTYYNCSASSYDAMKPINNAEVVLYKGGQEISRYTTDDEFNGAFVFTGLEPGNADYTVAVTAPATNPPTRISAVLSLWKRPRPPIRACISKARTM